MKLKKNILPPKHQSDFSALWGAIHSNWNFVLFSYDIYKNYIRNDMITTTRLSSFKSCSFVLKSCRFVFQLMSFCLKFQLMSLCLSTHVVMSFNSCRFVFQLMSFRHPNHVVMSSKSCRIVSASALSHATVACSRHSRTGALSATFWQPGKYSPFLRVSFYPFPTSRCQRNNFHHE